MKRVALITLMAAALAVGGVTPLGCSSVENAPAANEPTSTPSDKAQYEAPASGGLELSPSDQAGLDQTQCLVEEAAADIPPEEYEAWSEDLADEVVATNKDIATILQERGYSC